jgi:hypothetical protein
LEELADSTKANVPSGRLTAAECVDARHPKLAGRVLVRWDEGTKEHKLWAATLHGLLVRAGDRVVLEKPWNWPEPIVTGVIDGFALRPEAKRGDNSAPTVQLSANEAVCISARDGTPLVQVSASSQGAVVRLLSTNVDLDVPGDLRVTASAIELVSRRGELRLEASHDVVVQGETVKLNS